MTEYWKSQARKYCEFCKCWLADNKVSISFHENGKRHKENVKKHISQLSKKSAKDFKQKEKMDDEIKKMEAAAMAAYLKDVENNADITSMSIKEMLNNTGKNDESSTSGTSNINKEPIVKTVTPTAWREVKSENGSYYWNKDTNETTWDPPDDYLSLAQQEENELKEKEKEKKKKEKQKKAKEKETFKEVEAHIKRVEMKSKPASTFGPENRSSPFGAWKAVVNEPVQNIDLQLPKPDKDPFVPPVVIHPEERCQFKEKKVETLGEGPVEFKRRKFNNAKRNMRQKIDDD